MPPKKSPTVSSKKAKKPNKEKSPESCALGGAFRATRKQLGYTQEAFALKAGFDRSYYGSLERGESNMRMSTIMRVARELDTPAWKLWQGADL